MNSETVELPLEAEETPVQQEASELDKLAYQFQQANKLARTKQARLSSNSLIRVLNAVREFPLHEPKFRNKMEHELYILTLNAIAVKNEMVKIVTEEQQKLLKDAEEKNKEGEQVNV